MALDSTMFGLPKGTEIVFLSPQAAAKVGASSGYNAVHKVGERVRYELLKAGKTIGEASSKTVEVKQEVKPEVKEPVVVEAPAPQVKQEKKAKKEVKVEEEPKQEVPVVVEATQELVEEKKED